MLREGTYTKNDSKKIISKINVIKINSLKENGDQLQTTQINLENSRNHENLNKINNFIRALEVMKMNKIEVKRLMSHNSTSSFINSETDRNVMEFSQTNANLSKEENVVKYLNNPVIKNVEIINNNIRKKRLFNHNSVSAKLPYQMNILIHPFLEGLKMESIEEKEENEEKEIKNVQIILKSNNKKMKTKENNDIKEDPIQKNYSTEEEFYDSLDKFAIEKCKENIVAKKQIRSDEKFFLNMRNFSSNEKNENISISNLNEVLNSELNSFRNDIEDNTNHDEVQADINKDMNGIMYQTQSEEDSLCIEKFKTKCDKLTQNLFETNRNNFPQRIKQRATPSTNTNNKNMTNPHKFTNSNKNSNSRSNQNQQIKDNTTNAHTITNTFTITSKQQTSEAELNLDDLDEIKEINLNDYQIQMDSINKKKKQIPKKKLKVSELDVFKNYNVDDDFSNSINSYFLTSNEKKKNNKNSKILVVDSVINSADSIGGNNSNIIQMKRYQEVNKENTEHKYTTWKNEIKQNPVFPAEKKKMHIYSNSINVNNVYNVNMNNKLFSNSRDNRMITSSNKKTVRRKYYKSEIFESHGKDLEKYGLNILERSNTFENRKMKVNKNLINKFNEIEVVVDKNFESLNLLSDEEENTIEKENSSIQGGRKKTIELSLGNNTQEIELYEIQTISEFDNISCNRIKFDNFQTPKEKIRKHNMIDDVLIIAQMQSKETYSEMNLSSQSMSFENSIIKYVDSGRGNRENKQNNNKSKYNFANYKEKYFDEVEDSYADKVYDIDFVINMLMREKVYKPDSSYLRHHQRLDQSHRIILIDWLMEICEEFAFKRDTFHYAVNYIDRFLSNVKDISKGSLQLIGVASLSIAAKFEEIQLPKTDEYINATDNFYSIEEFMTTERYILQTLKWQIIPITINTWLNWYLFQWDLFLDSISEVKEIILNNSKEPIYFKKPDENYYFYYRQITQMIDLFTIDYESLKIPDRFLIAAAMFLTLCSVWKIEQFEKENMNKFDYDKEFFLGCVSQKDNYVVKIFSQFLKDSLNLEFDDPTLIDALTYAVVFLGIDFNYNLPLVIQSNNGDITHYEDFLSYQTHNDKNFEFLEKLNGRRGKI